MLLEQLAQKPELHIEFHDHFQPGTELISEEKPKSFKEGFNRFLLGKRFSSLAGILSRVGETDIDIVYVTNSNQDTRYENWTSPEQIELAVKAGYQIEQGEYYTFARKEGEERVIGLGKSQEVATTRGHALFTGVRRGKKLPDKKTPEETVKEATDGEGKIGDHSFLARPGFNVTITGPSASSLKTPWGGAS